MTNPNKNPRYAPTRQFPPAPHSSTANNPGIELRGKPEDQVNHRWNFDDGEDEEAAPGFRNAERGNKIR